MPSESPKKVKPPKPVQKAPAGWYDHPRMADTIRYWDGQAWTDSIAPKAPAAQGSSSGDNALTLVGLIFAILLPIVGFILGIVLMAKSKVGEGVACVLLSIVAFYVWYAFLSTPSYY